MGLVDIPLGPPSIENGAHGTEKLLLKTQVSEDFVWWIESNNIWNGMITPFFIRKNR